MAKNIILPIDFTDGNIGGCQCPPRRVVKRVYEHPESLKGWVNDRDRQLEDKIDAVVKEVERLLNGFDGKAISGRDGVKVISDPSTNFITLNIKEDEQILSQDELGVYTSLGIAFDREGKRLSILGKDNVVVASCALPVSGMPTSITKQVDETDGKTYVVFKYDGEDSFRVPINNFVDIAYGEHGEVYINDAELDLRAYLEKSLKTINGESIVGEGDIRINALNDEEFARVKELLGLDIKFDFDTNTIEIGGRKYVLTPSFDNRYFMGQVSTVTKTDFAAFTDQEVLSYAKSRDIATDLDSSGCDTLAVTSNLFFFMVPDTMEVTRVTLETRGSGLMTDFKDGEWADPEIFRQTHTDIVLNDIAYHVYGYRDPAMAQDTPTDWKVYLRRKDA